MTSNNVDDWEPETRTWQEMEAEKWAGRDRLDRIVTHVCVSAILVCLVGIALIMAYDALR